MNMELLSETGRVPLASAASDILEDETVEKQVELHAIRAGKDGTPLFVVASGVGWERYLDSLRNELDPTTPVYRIAILTRVPRRTVHGIATRVLQLIQRRMPDKSPLRIVGLGRDAAIAYQVAIHCVALDQACDFLGVLEELPGAPLPNDQSLQLYDASTKHLLPMLREYQLEPAPLELNWFGREGATHLNTERTWLEAFPAQRLRKWTLAAPASSESLEEVFGRQLVRAWRMAIRLSLKGRPEYTYVPSTALGMGPPGRPYLFCIPGAGASVVDFLPFAAAMKAEGSVIGLQARGMSGDFVPHGSVEAAARIYAKEVERIHPSVGVHLVGHSFGGWVAFEVARLLRQSGRAVRSLTLLDSDPPSDSGRVGREHTRPEALMALVSLYEQAINRPLGLCLSDFEARSLDEVLMLLHASLTRVGLIPKSVRPENLRGTVRSFEAALRTRYRPTGTFDGSTQLVVAREDGACEEAAVQRMCKSVQAWRSLVPNLKACRATGNHMTMLKPPHIAEVARWLRSVADFSGDDGNLSRAKAERTALQPQ